MVPCISIRGVHRTEGTRGVAPRTLVTTWMLAAGLGAVTVCSKEP